MPSRCGEFVDSRLRRSPPYRASAVPYGQGGENAMRFTRLAHRSAAAHKLHSTPQQDRMNLISGKGETSSRLPTFSLFLPGSCPNYRDRRLHRTRLKASFYSATYGPKALRSISRDLSVLVHYQYSRDSVRYTVPIVALGSHSCPSGFTGHSRLRAADTQRYQCR